MRSLKSTTTSTVVDSSAAAPGMQRSPWHSPVPYLFGGLAAMLGLIAFALLILACSYWKLSGQMNNVEEDDDEKKKGNGKGNGRPVVYEEQFVVILAGDDMPTCLAMPVCSKDKLFSNDCDGNNGSSKKAAADQNVKEDLEEEEEFKHQCQSNGSTSFEQSHESPSSQFS